MLSQLRQWANRAGQALRGLQPFTATARSATIRVWRAAGHRVPRIAGRARSLVAIGGIALGHASRIVYRRLCALLGRSRPQMGRLWSATTHLAQGLLRGTSPIALRAWRVSLAALEAIGLTARREVSASSRWMRKRVRALVSQARTTVPESTRSMLAATRQVTMRAWRAALDGTRRLPIGLSLTWRQARHLLIRWTLPLRRVLRGLWPLPIRPRLGMMAVFGLVAATLAVAQTGFGQAELRAAGLSRGGSQFVELYFLDPAGLPRTLPFSRDLRVKFVVRSDESATHVYAWSATQRVRRASVPVASGRVLLPAGGSTLITRTFYLFCVGRRTQLDISLSPTGPRIDEWLSCPPR